MNKLLKKNNFYFNFSFKFIYKFCKSADLEID
jgi:hypothetical protein